ncbi:MAG: autotransporter-associated beta strand repeat-containing protein [Akkermansiaceae bacterium]
MIHQSNQASSLPIRHLPHTVSCLAACAFFGLASERASAVAVILTPGVNNGPWALDPGNNTFDTQNNGSASVDGVISGTGNVFFDGNSNNNSVVFIDLNTSHTYDGSTQVRSSNARAGIRLGVNNALPTSTVLSLSSSNQGSGRPVWFDLNGFSQQVGGLGGTVNTNYNAIVNGNAGQAGVLIVAGAANSTYTQFLGANNSHPNVTSGATGIPDGQGNNFSLEKAGAGTLTLTRNNSYIGNTTIDAGTLSIQNAYLADAADIYMNSAAIFDLDYSGTDTVNSLFIDGASQAAGTWGAVGSGATNESALFTGNGLLEVTTFVPEPSSTALLGLGGLALILRRRR